MIYGKRYAKHEYKKLSKQQKKAVIDLNRQARNRNKSKGGNNDRPISAVTIDDLASVGDAIIAGITQAQAAPADDASDSKTATSEITTETSKRKAPAGGVGSYLADRRRKSRK